MIIGRSKEKSLLFNLLNSDSAEFLAVYGRRRIGKTFLIESFFENRKCSFFHFTGVQNGALREQLEEFVKEIASVFYGAAKIEKPTTWMQAFEALKVAIEYSRSSEPIVLFFDEFPWMATPRSRLLQSLEYYWNRFWKNDPRIKLIICGSSASWIIKKVIHHKGGLHNRITEQLHLKALDLSESKSFLEHQGVCLSEQKFLDLYCIVGGVPYYLSRFKKKLSIAESINRECFYPDGLLFNEFSKLFVSLFKDHQIYEELIRIISRNRHGISREEIEKNAKLTGKGGTLTQRLQDLEMAGFIKEFLPLQHRKKGLYYRILDEYSLFYLQWIEPEKANLELETDDNNFWLDMMHSPQYQAWRGYAFESVCYKHIAKIKQALGIKVSARVGVWRYVPIANSKEQGAQIDLLFDRRDDAITLCEIKCSDKPFIITKEYANNLQHKINLYRQITRTKKQLFFAIVSANGLKKNHYSEKLVDFVITLKDLF